MTDLLLQIALSNVCVSLALAIVAMVAETTVKRPHLAHLLWLLVFVKLMTPPVVTIPLIAVPRQGDTTAVAGKDHSRQGLPVAGHREFDIDQRQEGAAAQINGSAKQPATAAQINGGAEDVNASAETRWVMLERGKAGLSLIWLLGSGFVFLWSLARVYRFNRLLRMESGVAPQELQTLAARIGKRLGLKAVPTIHTTSAHLSPIVWWIGGNVRIVIPTALPDQMDARQFQWILAHELAHVRRRDYLIRWIEWLACVCFWWNPLLWWARHRLRANEEICCDDLVLSRAKPGPRTYADSLLNAIEYLASPAIRPPAVASEINSGGFLERRFKMIVSGRSNRSNSRWLQACVLLFAVAALPLGVAYAQDYDAVEKRLGKLVSEGALTLEHAGVMMDALREAAGDEHDEKDEGDIEARFGEWIGSVGEKLKKAVQAGKLSEEDAWKKWHHFKENELAPKLKATVASGHMSEATALEMWHALEKAEAGERLKAAVAKGEMTEKAALAKWAEINRGRDQGGHDLEAIWKKLQAMVKAGKLTEKQAHAKMAAIKKKAAGDSSARGRKPSEAEMGAVKKRIGEAIKAGKITEAQGKARWEAYLKGIGAAGVKAGKLSEEDASKKWYHRKAKPEEPREERKRTPREDYARAEAELRKAVATGRISAEDARARLQAMRKAMAGAGEHGPRRITREDYARAEAELRKAVGTGRISAEDARARLQGMRKMMGKPRDRDEKVDWDAIKRRIEGAVKAGKMTREEANKHYVGIKKEAARRASDDGRDAGIAGHYKKMGVSGETLGRIKRALAENGIKRAQVEPVLGGMLRVVHEMRSEGERFDLDPRLRSYFKKEVGLTDKQIELVQGIARRIIHGLKDSNRQRVEGGRQDERVAKYRAIEAQIKAAVKAGKLSPKDAERKLIATRMQIWPTKRSNDEKKDERVAKYRVIEAKIRAAVEAGKLSREDAERKLVETRKHMFGDK